MDITTATKENVGLGRFMSRVYTRTGLGVGSSVAIALLMESSTSPFTWGGGFALTIASVIGIGVKSLAPTYATKKENGHDIIFAQDKPIREACYWGLTTGMGLTMAPFVSTVNDVDPSILPASLLITASVLGGCSVLATRCKDAMMMQWKGPLMVGLGSLLGLQLLGIGSMYFFGANNVFAGMVHNVDVYGGVALFTGFAIYDSWNCQKMYLAGTPDHLGCATDLYLDAMNLLVRIMEILSKANNKRD